MPSINEPSRTALGAALKAGVDTLSLNQTITFTLYKRTVLPLDGWVYWVKASILVPDPAPNIRKVVQVMGSVHLVVEQVQGSDEVYANTRMVWTSEAEVRDFNSIGPDFMYFADFENNRYAFSNLGMRYQQANLWHYVGHAVNSVIENEIIDDVSQLPSTENLIVSNSLPAWLALNVYSPVYQIPLPAPVFQLYPEHLAPMNLVPPFGSVIIPSNRTIAHQSVPLVNDTYSQGQLAQDRVEVTLWGCDNDLALAWLANVVQYTDDIGAFGLVNMPVVLDDHRTQVDFLAIAKKKRIIFEVSYNQFSIRDRTRQLIKSAFMSISTSDNPVPPPPNIPIYP